MEEIRQRLLRARKMVATRLAPLGIVPWIMPRGGFYLWCRLPDGHDSTVIARQCLEEDVVLAPGNVFSVSQSAAAFLRINVAQFGGERVLSVLRRAMETG
jgi:DNA-binding transcriptional MocR family regulator